MDKANIQENKVFSEKLYQKMKLINPAITLLEPYEFCYALDNFLPDAGWKSITIKEIDELQTLISNEEFYKGILLKDRKNGQIKLDENIIQLTQMLFAGLVNGNYSPDWINIYFYFDVRGFYFLVRTCYFTEKIIKHLNGKPFRKFEKRQKEFDNFQSIGYKDFKKANHYVDQFFLECVLKLVENKGTPLILAIAGPTAAGKTEIVARLQELFFSQGITSTTIELDNFLTDRNYREEKGIDSLGKEALHFDLVLDCFRELSQGKNTTIPRYDFVKATSSHDLSGSLKPGGQPIEIESADVVFVEGNSPFLIPEAAKFISLKVVYLTDDPVRMKRKWKRDMDYRKKYELNYFRNRYFKEQFLMAKQVFLPQLEICDLVVDTSGAALWTTSEITKILNS